MKAKQLINISKFAYNHPIIEEEIQCFYNYWTYELDKYDIDANEFMQICCLLKCCTQKDINDISLAVKHFYRMLEYKTLTPVITFLYSILTHKESDEIPREIIQEKMMAIYRSALGVRYVWMLTILVSEYENLDNYKIECV